MKWIKHFNSMVNLDRVAEISLIDYTESDTPFLRESETPFHIYFGSQSLEAIMSAEFETHIEALEVLTTINAFINDNSPVNVLEI